MLLVNCALPDAVVVIERLRAATPGKQTCSAGLVTPKAGESCGQLMARADAALYPSKHAGRDQLTAVCSSS